MGATSGRDGSRVGQSKAIGIPLRGVGGGFGPSQCPLLLKVLGADPHTAKGQQGHPQEFGFACVAPPESLTSPCLPGALLQT